MMMGLGRRVVGWFGKITKEEVVKSNYDQLATMLAQKYGHKEYRNSNAACLHQIQHHFQVIREGDCVLDIGAGPDYYWTDLALKMAQNQHNTHLVVSNDLHPTSRFRPNNPIIPGDFNEEPVRTNLALQLGQRKIDAILVDVSPPYTGDIETDGLSITHVVREALTFGGTFLNKGGNLVCKVLECSTEKLIEQVGRIYFNQLAVFRPSVLRPQCPVKYLVMKGFAMNHNLTALQEFLGRYRGSAKNKVAVVEQYSNKYNWDPVQVINRRIKDDIWSLRQQGRNYLDIEKMFVNDPYVKITSIIKQMKAYEKALESNDAAMMEKALNKISDGKLYNESRDIPTSREEWIDFLDGLEKDYREFKKKKKQKDADKQKKSNLAPLQDNQVYLKQHEVLQEPQSTEKVYIQADLHGNFSPAFQQAYIEQQLQKLSRMNPQAASWLRQKRRKGEKVTLEEAFTNAGTSTSKVNKEFRDTSEALKAMTDQQYKQILDKQGYRQQVQQYMMKTDSKARLRFRNK